MKILIVGHARHGKDTVADILCFLFDLKKADSSRRSLEVFLYDILKDRHGYQDIEEAFADRVNHRAEWHEEIARYNTPDRTRLARNIMADSDIYVGMRCQKEIEACRKQGIFDGIIWVLDPTKPEEPESSFSISQGIEDVLICNNSTKNDGKLSLNIDCYNAYMKIQHDRERKNRSAT